MSEYKYYDTEFLPCVRDRDPSGQPVLKKIQAGDKIKIQGAFGIPFLYHHEMVTRQINGRWHSISVSGDGKGATRMMERPLYEAIRGRHAEEPMVTLSVTPRRGGPIARSVRGT